MTNKSGTCPTCEAQININENTEESEIITCSECQTRTVVKKIDGNKVILNQAPEVEEDWGE